MRKRTYIKFFKQKAMLQVFDFEILEFYTYNSGNGFATQNDVDLSTDIFICDVKNYNIKTRMTSKIMFGIFL